jgi:DNA-binding GntR family transcriptional regulator
MRQSVFMVLFPEGRENRVGPPGERTPPMPSTRRKSRQNHLELARAVVRHVQAQGMKAGDHLPEQRFADLCGVSRTPIRATFELLYFQGFLTKRPDEGYFLAVDPVEADAKTVRQIEEAEDTLATRILRDRAARRLGEVQTARALAQRYDAPRDAVLNALRVLARDGVVAQQPGQSWVFQPILDSPRAVEDSLNFRMILEPQAILSPGFALDPAEAATMRQTLQRHLDQHDLRTTQGSFHRLDTEFHALIARAAGNRFLRVALLAHHRLRRNTQKTTALPEFRIRQAIAEHLDILDALMRGDHELGADLMMVHLRRSQKTRPDAANRGIPPLTRAAVRGDA